MAANRRAKTRIWKARSVLLAVVTVAVAGAARADDPYASFDRQVLQLSTSVTSDSHVAVRFALPSGTRWLDLEIKRAGDSGPGVDSVLDPSLLARAETGEASLNAYLSQGPGEYQLILMGTGASAPFGSIFTSFASATVTNEDPRDLQYLLPSGDIQSDAPEIRQLATLLTAGASGDLKKAAAIHDWVARNVAYDAVAYLTGTSNGKIYDALTVLRTRLAVCQGYGDLTAALNRAAGLRSVLVEGHVESDPRASLQVDLTQCASPAYKNHAWNEVAVGGRWVTEDTTFDAGGINPATKRFEPVFSRANFDPDPATFDTTHVRCDASLQ